VSELPIDRPEPIVYSASYANHMLWTSMGTSVTVGGQVKSGVAWQALWMAGGGAVVVGQGTLAVPGNHIAYPDIATTDGFHAVLTATLTGDDYFPSAAFATITPWGGASPLHVYAAGQAPYESVNAEVNGARPRWGDYAHAVADGNAVWLANEYVGSACTAAQYAATVLAGTFHPGTPVCGGTRTALLNWDVRLARVQLGSWASGR
jgi:hypothetical protein